MTIGDPPPWLPWNDCYGYMPWLVGPYQYPVRWDEDYKITLFELADDRPPLWFWDC